MELEEFIKQIQENKINPKDYIFDYNDWCEDGHNFVIYEKETIKRILSFDVDELFEVVQAIEDIFSGLGIKKEVVI